MTGARWDKGDFVIDDGLGLYSPYRHRDNRIMYRSRIVVLGHQNPAVCLCICASFYTRSGDIEVSGRLGLATVYSRIVEHLYSYRRPAQTHAVHEL